jgi:hypothetical protein
MKEWTAMLKIWLAAESCAPGPCARGVFETERALRQESYAVEMIRGPWPPSPAPDLCVVQTGCTVDWRAMAIGHWCLGRGLPVLYYDPARALQRDGSMRPLVLLFELEALLRAVATVASSRSLSKGVTLPDVPRHVAESFMLVPLTAQMVRELAAGMGAVPAADPATAPVVASVDAVKRYKFKESMVKEKVRATTRDGSRGESSSRNMESRLCPQGMATVFACQNCHCTYVYGEAVAEATHARLTVDAFDPFAFCSVPCGRQYRSRHPEPPDVIAEVPLRQEGVCDLGTVYAGGRVSDHAQVLPTSVSNTSDRKEKFTSTDIIFDEIFAIDLVERRLAEDGFYNVLGFLFQLLPAGHPADVRPIRVAYGTQASEICRSVPVAVNWARAQCVQRGWLKPKAT